MTSKLTIRNLAYHMIMERRICCQTDKYNFLWSCAASKNNFKPICLNQIGDSMALEDEARKTLKSVILELFCGLQLKHSQQMVQIDYFDICHCFASAEWISVWFTGGEKLTIKAISIEIIQGQKVLIHSTSMHINKCWSYHATRMMR